MSNRERLPNRRGAEILDFKTLRRGPAEPISYTATLGYFADGRLAEVFLRSAKSGTDLNIQSLETAVAVSMALQYGCPAEVLRSAMPRTDRKEPEGAVGMLLDILATREAAE